MSKIILTHSLSAMETIRQVARKLPEMTGAQVIGSYDDYSHGPIPRFELLKDFFNARENYWKKFAQPWIPTRNPNEVSEYLSHIHPDFGNPDGIKCIEFWSANTVQDEMFLIVALKIIEAQNFDLGVCRIRRTGGGYNRDGLGRFNVPMMVDFYGKTQAYSVDLKLYQRAWLAVSQNSSEELHNFANSISVDLPLRRAMDALLLRYPEFNHSLGSIDRALLAAGSDHMKKSARTVGNAMVLLADSIDNVGDMYLFDRLVQLGKEVSDPWFEVDGDTREMRYCQARITKSGIAARDRFGIKPFT